MLPLQQEQDGKSQRNSRNTQRHAENYGQNDADHVSQATRDAARRRRQLRPDDGTELIFFRVVWHDLSPHHGDGRSANSEHLRIRVCHSNPHWEACRKMNPVQGSVYCRESIRRATIFWKNCCANAIDDSLELFIRMFHQKHIDVHTRMDMLQLRLPIARQNPPCCCIDQGEDGSTRMSVCPFRDIHVGHVAIEGGPDLAPLQIQLCLLNLRLSTRALRGQSLEGVDSVLGLS